MKGFPWSMYFSGAILGWSLHSLCLYHVFPAIEQWRRDNNKPIPMYWNQVAPAESKPERPAVTI